MWVASDISGPVYKKKKYIHTDIYIFIFIWNEEEEEKRARGFQFFWGSCTDRWVGPAQFEAQKVYLLRLEK